MYRIVIMLLTIVALSLSANSDKTKSHSKKIKKEVIDGYTLPPEPDPKINNATLLGVDVNHNGVRDDVERWIYHTYNHPIERGILMQSARAYQKVIVDPSKAKETVKYINNVTSCRFYWLDTNEYLSKKYEYVHITKEMRKIQFNTVERHIAYERYNGKLSGGVYGLIQPIKDKCEFDKNGILRDLK